MYDFNIYLFSILTLTTKRKGYIFSFFTLYCYERYEMLSDPIFLVNTPINIDFLSPFSQWEFEKYGFRPIRDRERDNSFKSIWQSSTMKIRSEWQVAALMCLGEQCKSNCDKTDKQSNIQILLREVLWMKKRKSSSWAFHVTFFMHFHLSV